MLISDANMYISIRVASTTVSLAIYIDPVKEAYLVVIGIKLHSLARLQQQPVSKLEPPPL